MIHAHEPFAVTNIGELVTNDPTFGDGLLGVRSNAAVIIDHGLITWVGSSSDVDRTIPRVDMQGRAMLPGFVDSHAHLVFAGDRAGEFAARMQGQPYTAGGIASTVEATRAATTDHLRMNLARRMQEMRACGVTTVETKSGYGLTIADEVRLLELSGEVSQETTFLGAHVVPAGITVDDYVEQVCGPMLAACAPLARWIDVFCETGAFDVDQSAQVLQAGAEAGLGLRVHANQLRHGPGVQLAVSMGAASADHCTHLDDRDIQALAASSTVATLLPAAEFSTRSAYPDARRLWQAGATVALATDCNPGTSFTTSMPLVIALAVREMHFTVEQAVWSATAGGAAALRRTDVGRVTPGARADLISLNAPSYQHLAYRPGVPLIDQVFIAGVA